MDYIDFYKLILSKQIDFIEKYNKQPKFVKVPEYHEGLYDNFNNIIDLSLEESIAGLLICDTITIKNLENCEVF